MENYHQITGEERYVISHLRKQGFTNSQIARQTGRHRSSIAQEIARNKRKDGGYRPCRAHQMARARRRGFRCFLSNCFGVGYCSVFKFLEGMDFDS